MDRRPLIISLTRPIGRVQYVANIDAELLLGGPLPKRWEHDDIKHRLAFHDGVCWNVVFPPDAEALLHDSSVEGGVAIPLTGKHAVKLQGDSSIVLKTGDWFIHISFPVEAGLRDGPTRLVLREPWFPSCEPVVENSGSFVP